MKSIIANNTIVSVFIAISLLLNILFTSFLSNVDTCLLCQKKEIFQFKSHLCTIYGAINIPIKLASKILRRNINIENNLKTLTHDANSVYCIIKKGKTNNASQKDMFLDVFLNSFIGFKSKIFKNHPNYKYKCNITRLFNISKVNYEFKLILIFLIMILSLPRGVPVFIKIINKNISTYQFYFDKVGFIIYLPLFTITYNNYINKY
ncbi:MAG: hypothetical protein LBU10_03635 [Endomicrobium sp.]|nr:hypothetical protein [Endomicrobium sp.]